MVISPSFVASVAGERLERHLHLHRLKIECFAAFTFS
jgi:hypothetical protein